MKKCENCSSLNNGEYGSGRFCSGKCARGFSTKNKRIEINEKISLSLMGNIPWNKGEEINKKCEECEEIFIARNDQIKFCSKKCQHKNKNFRSKLSLAMKERVEKGIHSGWQTRNIISYPEQFFIKVLNNNGLEGKYKINFKIKKKDLGINDNACYFLDFYFPDLKLDLEIDGRQHNIKERRESDEKRDKSLLENEIIVYRIKWKSINTDKGKKYIENEINKFLEYYGQLV